MRNTFLTLPMLLACLFATSRAQNSVFIAGTVVDAETQKSIPGVNVTVRGQKIGTSTDSLGRFELTLPRGSYIIAFSHVAYTKVVKGITEDQRPSIWRVKMNPGAIQFGEVTATAKKPFSQQRAIQAISAEEFEKLGEPDMDRALNYLLPTIFYPWYDRMRFPSRDITLYVNGEWKESIYLLDINPYTVQRVFAWDREWSPVGFPPRCDKCKYVVSIETR